MLSLSKSIPRSVLHGYGISKQVARDDLGLARGRVTWALLCLLAVRATRQHRISDVDIYFTFHHSSLYSVSA
jgi:hypothetical protein